MCLEFQGVQHVLKKLFHGRFLESSEFFKTLWNLIFVNDECLIFGAEIKSGGGKFKTDLNQFFVECFGFLFVFVSNDVGERIVA